MRRYLSFYNPFRVSLHPDCISLPGSPYTYAIPRYYFEKLFGKVASIYNRYMKYFKGLRYVFRGVSYSCRESWLEAIRMFRESYSLDYRFRFDRKLDLIPRPPRLPSMVRFKYLISHFNFNLTNYGFIYNSTPVSCG